MQAFLDTLTPEQKRQFLALSQPQPSKKPKATPKPDPVQTLRELCKGGRDNMRDIINHCEVNEFKCRVFVHHLISFELKIQLGPCNIQTFSVPHKTIVLEQSDFKKQYPDFAEKLILVPHSHLAQLSAEDQHEFIEAEMLKAISTWLKTQNL